MIKINKNEMEYLLSKGFSFGDSIHKTYTKTPHYYCNTGKPEKVLNEYRNSHIVETIGE